MTIIIIINKFIIFIIAAALSRWLVCQWCNTFLHKLASIMTNGDKYKAYFLHFHDLLAAILDFDNSGDVEKNATTRRVC